MPKLVSGSDLPPALQREARARFVHRYTGEHMPAWVRQQRARGIYYPVHFRDDAEWLARTEFFVNVDGSLSERPSYCYSRPTFPNGRTIEHR